MGESPYRAMSLMSQYRGVMFAVRTHKREMKYEDLRYLLSDALIEAAKLGAGVRLPEEKADNMVAYLLNGMLPTLPMPNNYDPLEAELEAALDKGTEQSIARAKGIAQALAMIRYPRSWEWANGKKRLEMVKKEMGR